MPTINGKKENFIAKNTERIAAHIPVYFSHHILAQSFNSVAL